MKTRTVKHGGGHVDIEELRQTPNGDLWVVINCNLKVVPDKKNRTKQDISRKAAKKYYMKNKRKILSRQKRNRPTRYKITIGDYERMVDEQGNRCKLCGNEPKEGKKLVIDHDHRNGKVRGLLCNSCNVGIGLLQDDPALLEKAINYIQSSQ